MIESDVELKKAVQILFPEDAWNSVLKLLVNKCGQQLPLVANNYVRVQLAVCKLSNGDAEKLKQHVSVANSDWRDVLVAAGFDSDVNEHIRWLSSLASA